MHKNTLIALFVLLLLAGGGYYLWQNMPAEGPEPIVEVDDSTYHSAQYGISFEYPESYALTEHDEGTAERMMHAIVLMDEDYANKPATEGPPAIAITIFENPEQTTLEDWVKGNANSNYKLSADGGLKPATIGGNPALSYTHSGLYENDAVVTMYNGRVYMFTAGWIMAQDAIRADFKQVVDSVEFVAS